MTTYERWTAKHGPFGTGKRCRCCRGLLTSVDPDLCMTCDLHAEEVIRFDRAASLRTALDRLIAHVQDGDHAMCNCMALALVARALNEDERV